MVKQNYKQERGRVSSITGTYISPTQQYHFQVKHSTVTLHSLSATAETADNTEYDKKNWSDEWLLRLNIDKCKSVSYCIKHPTDTGYHIMDRNQLFPLEKVKSMVDLGVLF